MVIVKPPIYFHFIVPLFYFPHRGLIKTFLLSIFKKHNKTVQALNYIFCSNKYLLSLNQKHLQHDYYTDIITFDLSENKRTVAGEIYVSVDRIRENARTLGVKMSEELHRVIFHGALHLCGFNDKSKGEKVKMTQEEDRNLFRYFSNVPRIPSTPH